MTVNISGKNTQRHVAIFNCAEQGHVNPTLGLVKALVARGYRVSYTTSPEFSSLVASCGATPVLFEPTFTKEQPRPEEMGYVVRELAREAQATCRPLLAAFENDRPDIIAYGPLSWLGKIFAHLWQVPAISLNPTHVSYQGQSEEWLGLSGEEWPCIPILEKMLHDNNLNVDLRAILAARDTAIAFIPRSFQEKPDTIPPGVTFVGPEIRPLAAQPGWRLKTAGRPVVVISLGSVYTHQTAFFRTCIQAFTNSEWHVVMAIGRYVDSAQLGELPANIEIHRQIPQLDVLQAASLFITHAGMNSLMEAVYFGVPMIAVPQQAEQRLNARRIQALGIGKYLPRETLSATSLLMASQEISADPACQRNLAVLQQEISQAGGASAAVDVFDRIMAAGQHAA